MKQVMWVVALAALVSGCENRSAPPVVAVAPSVEPSPTTAAPEGSEESGFDQYNWGLYVNEAFLEALDGSTAAQTLGQGIPFTVLRVTAEEAWVAEGRGPRQAVSAEEFSKLTKDYDNDGLTLADGRKMLRVTVTEQGPEVVLARLLFGGAVLPEGWSMGPDGLAIGGRRFTLTPAPGTIDRLISDEGDTLDVTKTKTGWAAVHNGTEATTFNLERLKRSRLLGTWLPQTYLDEWARSGSHARALAAGPRRSGGHDVLGIDDEQFWSNVGYHDGYALKPSQASWVSLGMDRDGPVLFDPEGWSYRQLSTNPKYYDVVAAWVLAHTFGDKLAAHPNIALAGNKLLIDGEPWEVILDPMFAYPDGVDLVIYQREPKPRSWGLKLGPPTTFSTVMDNPDDIHGLTGDVVMTL